MNIQAVIAFIIYETQSFWKPFELPIQTSKNDAFTMSPTEASKSEDFV